MIRSRESKPIMIAGGIPGRGKVGGAKKPREDHVDGRGVDPPKLQTVLFF